MASIPDRPVPREVLTADLDRLRTKIRRLRYTPEERRRLLALLDAAADGARTPPEPGEQQLLIAPDAREGRRPPRLQRARGRRHAR